MSSVSDLSAFTADSMHALAEASKWGQVDELIDLITAAVQAAARQSTFEYTLVSFSVTEDAPEGKLFFAPELEAYFAEHSPSTFFEGKISSTLGLTGYTPSPSIKMVRPEVNPLTLHFSKRNFIWNNKDGKLTLIW